VVAPRFVAIARSFWARRSLVFGIPALTVATRIRTLISTQGDANVGTYSYVAHQWLHGYLPYVKAWEYKPPGLFALYAAGLAVVRDASLSASLLATAAVILTAFSTYRILSSRDAKNSQAAPLVAAIFVVLLSTENSGIRGDAEIFVNAFIGLAFALAAGGPGYRATITSGIAAAVALQMKLTAIPLVVAVAAFLALGAGTAGLGYLVAYLATAAFPFALEALMYGRSGALPMFLDANVYATVRRAQNVHAAAATGLAQLRDEFRLLAPVLELAPFAFVRPSRLVVIPAVWLVAAFAAIAAAGEYYDRHFVLLVPPLAMLGALGVVRLCDFVRTRYRVAAIAAVVVMTFFLHTYYEVSQGIGILYHRYALQEHAWREGDYSVILRALRTAMKDDRSLFAVQITPEIYEDIGSTPPTRFVNTGDLFERPMWPLVGFPGLVEITRVFATKPDFVACGPLTAKLDPESVAFLRTVLARDYVFVSEARNVRIYRRRSEKGGGSAG
jgi:hypothetical protein